MQFLPENEEMAEMWATVFIRTSQTPLQTGHHLIQSYNENMNTYTVQM